MSDSSIRKEALKKKDMDPSFINERISIALVNILNKISVSTSFEDTFLSISQLIVEEIKNVNYIAFFLVDREIEMIQCLGKATKNLNFIPGNEDEQNIEIIQDFSRGILGVTAQTGIPTRASDLQREEFNESEICVPIKFENETIGLIWIEKPIALDFSTEDEKKLVYISNAFGGFIKSKLLTRQLQRSEVKLHEKNLELQNSTQFQEEIMSSMNEGLVIIDENLQIVLVNKKAEEELSYEAAELYNRSYVTIVADSSFFKVHEEIKKQKNEGLYSSFRARFLNKDSIEIPVFIHAAPYYSEGKFKGIIILFTNLSKLIEVEEEIFWLKGFRQRILDALPIGIVGISKDQRINYINDYFQTNIILSGGMTLLGKPLDHVFSESVLGSASSSVLLALEESFLDQKSLRINEVKFDFGNRQFIANLSLIPLFSYSDELIGVIIVFEDDTATYTLIDRLRNAYNELEERQDRLIREIQQRTEFQKKLIEVTKELRQKHLEMENFVYSISHDLKTPIVSIQGFIAAMTEDLTEDLSDNSGIIFYLNRIMKNTAYAKQLITDILEYSQLGQDTPVETVDSSEIMHIAIEQIESQIDFTNFKIIIEPHSYPKLQCQEKRILQVFVNLISNAWKYRDTSKEKSFLKISMEEDDKFWIFLFKDNGIGIPDSHRERIFVMFESTHPGPRDSIDGSGVRLAFIKKIIEIHNGRITVDSQVNVGSTFRVWLPKRPRIQQDRLF